MHPPSKSLRVKGEAAYMGLLSLVKNLNLGFSMLHIPTTASVGTMEAKEFKEAEQDNKTPLAGNHNEITGVEKDARLGSDEENVERKLEEAVSGQKGLAKFKENVERKLEKAVSGQKGLAKFKGDHELGNIASSENGVQECELNFLGLPIRLGEKECQLYMRTGGCKFASSCRFHHPDPAPVVGDSLQDLTNGVPSEHHGPVEQLCETRRPSENTSNDHTAFLGPFMPNRGLQQNVHWIGNQIECSNPSLLSAPGKKTPIEEPVVKIEMLTPKDYISPLMELGHERRGVFKEINDITEGRASIIYELPLAEMAGDFLDQLKSRSKGYASIEFSFVGYKESELVKLDIRINGEPVEQLATIVHKDKADAVGRALTVKLKELIPRQTFKIHIQTCIGPRVVASETLPAIRKDVLSKCNGGDITRNKKLLKKQMAKSPLHHPPEIKKNEKIKN